MLSTDDASGDTGDRRSSFGCAASATVQPSLSVKTAPSWRGILPFTHLAREGRMTVTMGRRQLLAALGGGAVAWPLAARAQQPAMPVIGFLEATTAADTVYRVSAFRDGLKEAGFIDGHNLTIEFRWAENKFDRLPALATDLVQR